MLPCFAWDLFSPLPLSLSSRVFWGVCLPLLRHAAIFRSVKASLSLIWIQFDLPGSWFFVAACHYSCRRPITGLKIRSNVKKFYEFRPFWIFLIHTVHSSYKNFQLLSLLIIRILSTSCPSFVMTRWPQISKRSFLSLSSVFFLSYGVHSVSPKYGDW